MENNTSIEPTRDERRSLALSALIMSLVAMFCAFITGWRIFSIVVAGASLIVACFILLSVRHKGRSRRMSFIAIIASFCAVAFSWYFLANMAPFDAGTMPSELHGEAAAPAEATLEKLRRGMDSTQGAESTE